MIFLADVRSYNTNNTNMLIAYENYLSRRRTDFPEKEAGIVKLVYPGNGVPGRDYKVWLAYFRTRPKTGNFEFDGNRPITHADGRRWAAGKDSDECRTLLTRQITGTTCDHD